MKFSEPLMRGYLVKRYKRFLADVKLEAGGIVTAHCPNSGSMLSVNQPGSEVWLSTAKNPERKLKFTWEMIRVGRSLVGINTQHPNKLVAEAIEHNQIEELAGYSTLRREVKYGTNSRIDILLEDIKRGICYIEVKNVTMRRSLAKNAPIEFPDGITTRGAKHLNELSKMVKAGHRAVMLYLVQRSDSRGGVTIARDIDFNYGEKLDVARATGVEVLAYGCKLSPRQITIAKRLEFFD